MAYAQRLERDTNVDVREAFKVLHQGLSCLAGQISATDNNSAHVAARLTSNWELLARRLTEMRLDFDDNRRVLDARLSASEKTAAYNSTALEHALDKIEAFAAQRALDRVESQRQVLRQEQLLERLSAAFLRLEKSLPDSNLSHRLEAVEQATAGLAEWKKPDSSDGSVLSLLQALSHRLEALEKDHGALVSQMRSGAFSAVPQSPDAVPLIEPPALAAEELNTAAVPDFADIFAEPGPLNFPSPASAPDRTGPRYYFPAALALVAALAVAGGLLLQQRMDLTPAAKPAPANRTSSLSLPRSQFVGAPQPGGDANSFVTQRSEPGSQDSLSPAGLPPRQQLAHKIAVNPVLDDPKLKARPLHRLAPPADRVQQLANRGNVLALTILGLRAADGTDGAVTNLPDAVKYLTEAAEKGQPVAQYRLGTLYEHGLGVAPDAARASHWYQLSANQGNRKAMHNLAVYYASRRDMADAARWFAKAASLGLSDSQFNLAILYERGDGVPQSLVDAFKWYSIAGAAGDAESRTRIAVLQTQLNDADQAMAAKAVIAFRPLPFDRGANVPPQASELPSG